MRVYDERMSELKDELRAVDSRERIRRAQAEADAAVRASDEKAAALGIPR